MILENRFKNLVNNYTHDSLLITELWFNLNKHYTEKHRAYHNFSHLEELFTYFDKYVDKLKSPEIVTFSIFYHDVIYNIWKKDNEEKSADFAIIELSKLNLTVIFKESVYKQIIATKTHNAIDNDTKYLVDFDLAILGQKEEIYTTYNKLIKEEYKLIPNLIYNKGRKKVLQHFIDKPSIYSTSEFKNLYEQQAKLNLTNELNTL